MTGSKKISILLAVSVVINIFVLGAAAGHFWVGPLAGKYHSKLSSMRQDHFGPINMRSIARHADMRTKQRLRQNFQNNKTARKAIFDRLRENENAIKTAVTMVVFDAKAVTTLLEEHDTIISELHLHQRALMVQLLSSYDHETRQKIAKSFFKRHARKGHPRQNEKHEMKNTE